MAHLGHHDYVICSNYKKFKNLKISYIFEKTLALSVICSKCENDNEKIFKEEEPIEILKILGLIKYIYTYFKKYG